MATNYIEVTPQKLSSDVKSLESDVRSIKSDMKKMFESVRELDTMWEGTAKNTFTSQFEVDYQTFEEIVNVVNSLVSSMDFAHGEYVKCEASVEEEINSINV